MLELIIFEDPMARGRRWYTYFEGRPLYHGYHPHFGAARKLLAMGYDPDMPITTCTNKGTLVFRSTLRAMSYWTTTEADRGSRAISLAAWRPRPNLAAPDGSEG